MTLDRDDRPAEPRPEDRPLVAHGFTFYRNVGGVQGILRGHYDRDAAQEIDSQFVVYFERFPQSDARRWGLGLTWRSSIRSARRRLASWATRYPNRTCVYHDLWGLAFFADVDAAFRRIGHLHSAPRPVVRLLGRLRGLLDGVLCVSPTQVPIIRECLPEISPERLAVVPNPVAWDRCSADQAPLGERPLRLGYSGRLTRQLKRVDRLPPLCEQLESAGIPFELEILGSGPAESGLRREFAGKPHVRFLGVRQGAAYRATISQWDVILFVSETEGMPVSLLEALSCGVLPVFPRIGSGGDDYVRQLDSMLLYDARDIGQVVQALVRLRQMPSSALENLRLAAHRLVAPHLGDNYYRSFRDSVRRIHALPRISPGGFLPRPRWVWDYCPFGVLRRVHGAGFFQATPVTAT